MGLLKKSPELSSSLIYQPDCGCIELIKSKEFLLIRKKEKTLKTKHILTATNTLTHRIYYFSSDIKKSIKAYIKKNLRSETEKEDLQKVPTYVTQEDRKALAAFFPSYYLTSILFGPNPAEKWADRFSTSRRKDQD